MNYEINWMNFTLKDKLNCIRSNIISPWDCKWTNTSILNRPYSTRTLTMDFYNTYTKIIIKTEFFFLRLKMRMIINRSKNFIWKKKRWKFNVRCSMRMNQFNIVRFISLSLSPFIYNMNYQCTYTYPLKMKSEKNKKKSKRKGWMNERCISSSNFHTLSICFHLSYFSFVYEKV